MRERCHAYCGTGTYFDGAVCTAGTTKASQEILCQSASKISGWDFPDRMFAECASIYRRCARIVRLWHRRRPEHHEVHARPYSRFHARHLHARHPRPTPRRPTPPRPTPPRPTPPRQTPPRPTPPRPTPLLPTPPRPTPLLPTHHARLHYARRHHARPHHARRHHARPDAASPQVCSDDQDYYRLATKRFAYPNATILEGKTIRVTCKVTSAERPNRGSRKT